MDLGLVGQRRREVQGGAKGLDGVDGTAQTHEAVAQLEKGLGGLGVGLVDGGVSIGDARLAEVAEHGLGSAQGHLRLVRRCIVGIGGGCDERRDGVGRATGGEKRAALVAGERATLAIRRVEKGVGVRLGGVGVTAELHERVALEVVRRTANLAGLPDDGGGRDDSRPITVLIGGTRRLECLLIHVAPSLGDLRYARSCSIRTELMTSPARSSEMTSKPSTQVPKTVYPLSRPCWGPRQK